MGLTYVISSGLDLSVEPVLVLVPEGRVAHEEDIEDDTAGPNVHSFAVGLFLQDLRGQVAGGTGETLGRRETKTYYLVLAYFTRIYLFPL